MGGWKTWNPPEIPENLGCEFKWGGPTAPYATSVYFGQGRGKPARPWAEYTIETANHEQMLADAVIPLDFEQTFVNYAYSLGFAFEETFEEEIWSWPRETIRTDGTIAGLTRNLIDTRRLQESQQIQFFGVSP